MLNQISPLTICVCPLHGTSIEGHILDKLVSEGFNLKERDAQLFAQTIDIPLDFDVILVDWRDCNKEVSNLFSALAGQVPVVALIDAHCDQQDTELLAAFSDFVCEEELALASFKIRLRRLISRYRNPLTLSTTNSPEAALLQTVVNHSSDWLFIKDLDHRFLSVSEEYANSLDRSLDAVIGKNDLDVGFSDDVVHGGEKTDWQGFWPQDDYAVEHGVPTVETNPYWRVFTGDTRHRKTTRVPLKNRWGQVYALLICSEDVTAIVKSEQVLKERSDMLEKMTQEKLRADHSRLMAELAVTAKNKFIATASHDLRQPLHALGLYLDVLDSKLVKDDERALIGKIKNSSKALSVLFNSLLDLSRLDAGVVDVESGHFAIGPLLNGLNEEFSEVAADKSLKIKIDQCNATLYTDAVLVERILRNLIQNAITYTNKGSVQVLCEVNQAVLLIKIVDTGPGIPQYEQNAIFSEYYQLEHDGRRPTIGLGLGLAIVRRLVDLLEIKFELHSKKGEGSTFSIELPLGDVALVEAGKKQTNTGELTGHTILVIDDEVNILDGMVQILNTHDCLAVSAVSAAEAITNLTNKDIVPTAIVADYRLENGQTGDAAIELVREEFNCEIPAIIVTGDTSADRLLEATKSGFRLLHKPVQPRELIEELANLLEVSNV